MRVFFRFVFLVVLTSILFDWTGPHRASAEGCPCTSNSPIVNPFPIRSLRWGTGRVMRGTQECNVPASDDPHLAIAKVKDERSDMIRGFQLIVVDKDHIQRCAGTQLAGVIFDQLLSKGDEPVVIRQVAKARVTPVAVSAKSCVLEEYRFAYLLAAASRPNDSVCAFGLKNRGVRRVLRRVFGKRVPALPSPQGSSDCPVEIPQDQLVDYAVVLPDADHDSEGNPQTSSSDGLVPVPDPRLEWYELACAGGALAHTDLGGLVEPGEPKTVRTAAMRMIRANYKGGRAETIKGIPINFRRDKPHTCEYLDLCKKREESWMPSNGWEKGKVQSRNERPLFSEIEAKEVEARWGVAGATCVNHSRLWMKDTLVYPAMNFRGSLEEKEIRFVDSVRTGGRGRYLPACTSNAHGEDYFTSGVVHHIDHATKSEILELPAQ
jgi:ADYC domain